MYLWYCREDGNVVDQIDYGENLLCEMKVNTLTYIDVRCDVRCTEQCAHISVKREKGEIHRITNVSVKGHYAAQIYRLHLPSPLLYSFSQVFSTHSLIHFRLCDNFVFHSHWPAAPNSNRKYFQFSRLIDHVPVICVAQSIVYCDATTSQ